MFFGSKKVLGLDIGTSSIKLAELDISRRGAQLQAFGFVPTPPGCINAGEILNPTELSFAIRRLVGEGKTKTKKAGDGMWGNSGIVKKITLPRIEPKMVAEQVRFEAEQYIPFDINEVSLDYHIIDPKGSSEAMDLLLIAAQNEVVNQYSLAISGGGLETSVIDVSGFAFANCYEANYGRTPGEAVVLINVGAGITNFVVVANGDVIFNRDVPVGGLNYTNEIHKEMGITVPEAESLKLSAVSRGEVPEEVNAIISSTNEGIADEIRSGYDFFMASSMGITPLKGFVTGGSSAMPGLIEGIGRTLGFSVEVFNPFRRIGYNARRLDPTYLAQISPFVAVAIGLGLRKEGDR